MLHQSFRSGGNLKLSCFHSHFVSRNDIVVTTKQSTNTSRQHCAGGPAATMRQCHLNQIHFNNNNNYNKLLL